MNLILIIIGKLLECGELNIRMLRVEGDLNSNKQLMKMQVAQITKAGSTSIM